jgi:DMSO/TMAO reductase YedYZ molybdopterin-dependent catalytic subunit
MSERDRREFSSPRSDLVRDAVDTVAERLRERGAIDRRGLLRLAAVGVLAPLAAACNASPRGETSHILKAIGAQNERLERLLLRVANGSDRVPRGVRVAGDRFPAYWVSPRVPMWDAAANGAWRLRVDGAVRTPLDLSFDDLRRLATRTQRVHHYCVEGWSAVASFQGVPFITLATMAGLTKDAGHVDFASFDNGYHESWDVESAMHPQTLVVVAKDGTALSPRYGAPARIHGPIKLGYKNTKYLTRITFMPAANGGYWSDRGYEWFGGT